ncbi:MAG: AAA family ATPase [Bacteroidota bacterium]
MKLDKLHIKKFRGASQPITLEFDQSKKITMLFGENGMGKSTIADALVCLCTDKLGSISDKSSIDKDYIRTLNCQSSEVAIKLETNTGTYLAKLNGTGSSFVKTPIDNIPTVRHLRRSQIISLIDAEPSKRYEALKDYIDVANIIKSEDELRKAHRTTINALENIRKAIIYAESTLKNSWEAEGSPNTSFHEWAKLEADKDITEQQLLHQSYIGIIGAWREVESKRGEVVKALKNYNICIVNETDFLKIITDLEAGNSSLDNSLLNVLIEAEKFIKNKSEIENCPVCERPENKNDLLIKISARVELMKEFQKAQLNLKEAKKLKEQSENTLKTLVKSFIDELDIFIPKFNLYVDNTDSLQDILNEIADGNNNNDKYRSVNKNLLLIVKKIKEIELDAGKILKSINQYNLIKQHHNTSVINRSKRIKANYLADATEKALQIVESTRKRFIEEELLSISKDVEEFYQKMHPDEQLGGIKLFLKPGAKNSLELNADFYTSLSVTPQSLYSESHLDTLGICIFLALAKKYNDGNTILILDDVVMSVDEDHLDRFIELLHEQVHSFSHILITTHYRPWKDRYRHNRAPTDQVHFVELRKWNLATGIRLQNSKIDIHELRNAIDADYFDRQRISNLAGTILENILDFLSIKYQCKISRKVRQDYVLSELLNCLSSKLLKVMKVAHLEKNSEGVYDDLLKINEYELKPIIDVLKQLSAIRNQVGSHYNFDGSLVSDSDIEEFGNKVYDFAKLLICPINGNFPDKNKSGSYHETRTGSIRLYPLMEPS